MLKNGDKMETIEQIKADEGYRAEPYICTAGKLTWLYGRNIEDRPITKEEWGVYKLKIATERWGLKEFADWLFKGEVQTVYAELKDRGFNRFNHDSREANIIIGNMAYNMGTTRFNPKKWPNFFAAIERKDYDRAATEMEWRDSTCKERSRWYLQTGNRSKRLVESMRRLSFDEVM